MGTIRPRNFIDLFTMLWNRKLPIVLTVGIVSGTGWLAINKLPNLYESHATALVNTPQNQEAQEALRTQVAEVTQQLVSRPELESLIRRHHLKRESETEEAAVLRLGKEIKVETKVRDFYPNAPESVSLTWRHTDPQVALKLVTELSSALNEINLNLKKQATVEADQLKTQLATIEEQLRGLARRRAALTAPSPSALPVAEKRISGAELTAAIETLNDKQYALEQQVSQQQRQVEEQQKLLAEQRKSPPPGGNPQANSPAGALLVRKAEIEGQLKTYARLYTEKHPEVIKARNQLASINQQLSQLESRGESAGQSQSLSSPEATELRTMLRDLNRLQVELDVTRRDLARKKELLASLPPTEPKIGSTGQTELAGKSGEAGAEYDLLMSQHNTLQDRLDQLQRRTGITSVGNARLFRLAEQPALPQFPAAPKRMLLRIGALLLGLLLGLAVALALEGPKLLFVQDARDVEYLLGAPILGLIPQTLVEGEERRIRQRLLKQRLLWILLAAVSVPVMTAVLTRLPLFQIIANR
jgi:capsular polysaccharide biosynthesis protein